MAYSRLRDVLPGGRRIQQARERSDTPPPLLTTAAARHFLLFFLCVLCRPRFASYHLYDSLPLLRSFFSIMISVAVFLLVRS